MIAARGGRRARRLPEVLQTSTLDCGPASLTSALRHVGLPASYEALRDLCATDVDGTSIDAMEAVAVALGVDAAQMVVPVEHVLALPEEYLPAIAVTLLPDGFAHFVVLGHLGRRRVEIMDPAGGRRRLTRAALAAELHRHPAPVPADGWRDWAGSDVFTTALRLRLRAAGVGPTAADALLAEALADPGITGLATLDAALRQLAAEAHPEAPAEDPAAFISAALASGGDGIPDEHRSCVPGDDPDTVTLRGAVIVRMRPGDPGSGDPDLLARVAHPDPGPWAALDHAAPGLRAAAVVLAALGVVAGGAAVVEAIALRPLVDPDPAGFGPRSGAGGRIALAALAASTVAVMAVVAAALARGRHLEGAVRRAWWDAVARLPEGFVRTRPASDLAERGHLLHRLRELPVHGARLALAAAVTVVAASTTIVAAPAAAPAVVVLLLVVLGGSALGARRAAEADLRVRTLSGCLSRPVADALQGAATTAHRPTAAAVRHEHERTLGELRHALAHHVAVTAGARAAVTVTAAGALTWALARTGADDPAQLLLVLVCGLLATDAGAALVDGLRTVPASRSVAARAAGPLAAAAHAAGPVATDGAGPLAAGAGDLRLDEVGVTRGDRTLLAEVDLHVPAGSHVAVVGPSGAGKTTLLEVIAGLVTPTTGKIEGVPPPDTVTWSTPGTRLWNDTVEANVAYGTASDAAPGDERLEQVEAGSLATRVDRRANGVVGDGGGLLSDGEAQRVRLARALGRPDARLVVLDEAFRGLERDRRRRLLARTRHHWADATLICALHDVADAATMDLVVVVDDGRVVEVGEPTTLAADESSHLAGLLSVAAADGLDGWHVRDLATLASPGSFDDASRPSVGSDRSAAAAPEAAPPAPADTGPVLRAGRSTPGDPASETGQVRRAVAAWGGLSVLAALAATALIAMAVAGLGAAAYDGAPIRWVRTGTLLAAAAALATAAVAAGGRLGLALSIAYRRRAIDRALAVDPDRARGLGVGRTLAVAIDADLVGAFLVATGPAAVLAFTEIAVALALAPRSVAPGPTMAIIAVSLVATGVLGAVQLGRRRAWTGSRAGLTGRLVERLVGVDTVRLQDDPDQAATEADTALAAHERAGRRLDRAALALTAVPGVALVTLVAMVVVGSDGRSAMAVAASLGIALLAASGLDRTATVAGDAVGALDAHRGVASLDALSRPSVPSPDDLSHLAGAAAVPAPPAAAGAPAVPLLAAVGITATFDEGRAGLTTPLDLVVRDGDRIVLRGPSGGGKTTFGEVLAGHRPATTGRLAVAPGTRVVRVASAGDDHIFSASLLFNLACGAAWPPDDDLLDHVDAVVAEVGLDTLVSRLPGGLSQPVGDGGWRLSAGEAARVALVRALVQRPDVVVLDETIGPLDTATRDVVLRAVARHSRASILIAHV